MATYEEQTSQDLYEEKAMMLVEQLIEKQIIKMNPDEPILHHVPTGARFESVENMAHFHKGWEAAKG